METFPALMKKITAAKGDHVAIYDRGREVSYSELQLRSRQLATGLLRMGVEKDDRIAIWLPNCAAYLEFFLACAQIGAIVISLNTKFRNSEVEDILQRSKSKMLVFWPEFRGIDFRGILQGVSEESLKNLTTIITYSEQEEEFSSANFLNKKVVSSANLYDEKILKFDPVTPDTGLVVFTTSGTTGKPKFVLHTQRSITIHAIEVAARFNFAHRQCRLLQVNPLCGTFGLTQALAGFAGGGTVYCLPVFDAEEAANLIQQAGITDINGSDDMYAMLLAARSEPIPYPTIIHAGFAAFNPALTEITENAEERGLKLVGLWGMSEVQAFTSHQLRDDQVDTRKLAGGHLLSKHARIRVMDPETNEELAFGQMGELEISCPSQMKEYLDNPEATQKTITDDGYIKTGDLAVQLSENSFTFMSRIGDTLRLGGYLTDPVEIEECLRSHSSVQNAQVVGVDTNTGTKAFAFIILENNCNLDKDELSRYCKAHLAGYKIPIEFCALTEFPVTQSANGVKIQRAKLREMAIKIMTNNI